MTSKPRQTLALIDLAVDSGTRKPRIETALNRLDGLTLLEWSIRRLGESTLVDSVVVTGPAKHRSILNQSRLCHAKWIPSVLTTPAQRAAEIADSQNADWVVHVNPMCPFMDPALVDRLIARGLSQAGCDFVGFGARVDQADHRGFGLRPTRCPTVDATSFEPIPSPLDPAARSTVE